MGEADRVERRSAESIVELCPVEAFHYLLELPHVEVRLCPVEYGLEVSPEVVGVWVMLVVSHVAFYGLPMAASCLVLCHPFESFLQVILSVACAVHEVFAQAFRTAVLLREVAFGIADKMSRKDGIVYFLVVQHLARDVDSLEPVELLRRSALADIDVELVVEDFLLYVGRLIVKVLEVHREVSSPIFAERKRTLLPVHHLIGHFGIVAPLHPVHHVKRIAV